MAERVSSSHGPGSQVTTTATTGGAEGWGSIRATEPSGRSPRRSVMLADATCPCLQLLIKWRTIVSVVGKGACIVADVTKTLKDAAYVAVGLIVLGFQKAQV